MGPTDGRDVKMNGPRPPRNTQSWKWFGIGCVRSQMILRGMQLRTWMASLTSHVMHSLTLWSTNATQSPPPTLRSPSPSRHQRSPLWSWIAFKSGSPNPSSHLPIASDICARHRSSIEWKNINRLFILGNLEWIHKQRKLNSGNVIHFSAHENKETGMGRPHESIGES